MRFNGQGVSRRGFVVGCAVERVRGGDRGQIVR